MLAASGTRAAAEDKFLTSAKLDNFELYYELHGDGPSVVFAHGAGGTHMSWWQQVPVLAQRYKCITIDHRTFGYSRDVKGGPGRRAFVQDLKGLLDQLGILWLVNPWVARRSWASHWRIPIASAR